MDEEEREIIDNYIQRNIDSLEQPNKDYHLAFRMEGEMRFFDNNKYSENWADRLSYFDEIDIKQNYLVEAVYYYGRWKLDKVYAEIEKSMDFFKDAEFQAIENNWSWILTTSTKYQKTLYYQFDKKDRLEALGERISNYIIESNEAFPTRAIMDLTKQVIELLEFLKPDQITKVGTAIKAFTETESINHPFRYGFLDACIALKKHEKDEKAVANIHRDILGLKIQEAESKGSTSKIILSALLEQALTYCVDHVGDRTITEDLKKRIDSIDYTDELKVIEVPEELRKNYEEALKKYDEQTKSSVKIYINKIIDMHPIQILYIILNDETIFNMNVENTKSFTDKLLKESLSNLFPRTVDYSHKKRKIDSDEEKFQAKLHENLLPYLQSNLNLIYYIFNEIENKGLLSIENIYPFLNECSIINEKDHPMIIWGILQHIIGDYISSISILMPKIESALSLYLKEIGADVTSYDSRALSKKSLGGLIELDEIHENFSIDFQYFLKLFLTAEDGINFRNRISHGSTKITEYTQKASLLTIFILLKIYAKTFKIPEKVDTPPV